MKTFWTVFVSDPFSTSDALHYYFKTKEAAEAYKAKEDESWVFDWRKIEECNFEEEG